MIKVQNNLSNNLKQKKKECLIIFVQEEIQLMKMLELK